MEPVSWQASNTEPRKSRRASGSRLAIGSSSRNSSGLLASTRVSATWARSPPDRALIRARGRCPAARSAPGHDRIEPAVHGAAYLQDIGDPQPRPQRRVLGDEPDPVQPPRRCAPGCLDRSLGDWKQARCHAHQGGLARAVRPDQGHHPPGRHVQVAVAQAPQAAAIAVPRPAHRSATLMRRRPRMARLLAGGRLVEGNLQEHPDLLGRQPVLPGPVHPAGQRGQQPRRHRKRCHGGAAATNVPTPCRRTTIPWCSSSLNAFTTVFGLTDSAFTTSFTLGS